MKSNFFKSEVGLGVRAKLCEGLNYKKLLGSKVVDFDLNLILSIKIFHKNYSHLQKILKMTKY